MLIIVYISTIFINQQKTLMAYKDNNDYYKKQIEEKTEYQKSLIAMKDNIN